MSTLILNPVSSYFNPFVRIGLRPLEDASPAGAEFANSRGLYASLLVHILVGTVVFVVLLSPGLAMGIASSQLLRGGSHSVIAESAIPILARCWLACDVLLYVVFTARVFFQTFRAI